MLFRDNPQTSSLSKHVCCLSLQGFPRSDIDIPQIRADRHKVITLTNDHKELTNQMELLLHKLHAQSRQDGTAVSTTPYTAGSAPQEIAEAGGAVAIAVESRSNRPFAVIDIVESNSPASEAGIQVGDMMIRFGSVTGQTPNPMQAVAKTLQESEGKSVETEFVRKGNRVVLILKPKKWSGRGLLGCHLTPL